MQPPTRRLGQALAVALSAGLFHLGAFARHGGASLDQRLLGLVVLAAGGVALGELLACWTSRRAAIAAVLLWVAHPLAVSVVADPAGRRVALALALLFVALLVAERGRPTTARAALAFGCTFAAVACDPVAVVAPAVVVLRDGRRRPDRRRLWIAVLLGLLGLALSPAPSGAPAPLELWRSISHAAWPVDLPVVPGAGSTRALLLAAVFAALVAHGLLRRPRAWSIALVVLGVTLLAKASVLHARDWRWTRVALRPSGSTPQRGAAEQPDPVDHDRDHERAPQLAQPIAQRLLPLPGRELVEHPGQHHQHEDRT